MFGQYLAALRSLRADKAVDEILKAAHSVIRSEFDRVQLQPARHQRSGARGSEHPEEVQGVPARRTPEARGGDREAGTGTSADEGEGPARLRQRLVQPSRADLDGAMAGARAQYKPRNQTIWINQDAQRILDEMLGDEGGGFTALSLDPVSLLTLTEQIERWRDNQPRNSDARSGLNSLLAAFRVAQRRPAPGEVSLVVAEDGATGAVLRARLRHERFHGRQREIGGGWIRDHIDSIEFLRHPLAERAAGRLEELGYHGADELAAEIGAHLAGGPRHWRSLGLTDSEASDLWVAYLDALIDRHGRNVLRKVDNIAPGLQEILNAKREEGQDAAPEPAATQADRGEAAGPEVRGPPRRNAEGATRRVSGRKDSGEVAYSREPREEGPHGPIFREFYHDAQGAIAKLRNTETGEAVAALHHPEVGDIDLIWGKPGENPRKGFGLAKIVKWHSKEGVLDDLQGLINSMEVNPDKSNWNTYQLENATHIAVLRRNWEGQARKPWVLTTYRDKEKERKASSAERTIDIPGTREEDWPSPPLGDATSNIPQSAATVNLQIARGTAFLREGVTSFGAWSKRMIAEFGEAIRPHLARIFEAAKRFAKDETGELRLPAWGRRFDDVQQHFDRPVPALLKLKHPAVALGKALRWAAAQGELVMPVDWRLEREGRGAGKPLMDDLRRAGDWGEVAAGTRLVRLVDARLGKLNRAQRFNLLDVLEGHAEPMDAQVQQAFLVSRQLLDEIAQEAEALEVRVRGRQGWQLFEALPDYFPHVIRDADTLRNSAALRKDIIEHLVRRGHKSTPEEAKMFLDEYVEFLEGGGRMRQLLAWMVDSGQAADEAEALARLDSYRRHTRAHRHGSIEHSREVNLPFYDPDPVRVLPYHLASSSMRLAQIAYLGQDGGAISRHLLAIDAAGGNDDWVKDQVDKILGIGKRSEEKAANFSRTMRLLQGFKLGLASIPNSTQGVLNSLLAADLPATAAGFMAMFSKDGHRLAIQAGATIDPILHESLRELAGGGRVLETFLRATGFTVTERMNRVFAANAGAVYAQRMLKQLQRRPGHKRARRALTELGVDVDAALARGSITPGDVLLAAKRFSDMTQFRSRPQDLPEFASTPYGKIFFQFKTFAYNQTRLVYRSTVSEARHGEWGRAFRSLFILATVFPLTGEALQALRNLITGREREEDLMSIERWLDNAASVGSLGILWDMVQNAQYGGWFEGVAGPTAGMADDIATTLFTDPADWRRWKRNIYRHAPLGSVLRRAEVIERIEAAVR